MFDFIARENPEYVDALYREYRRDPRAVDERWAFVFSAYELGLAHGAGGATGPEVGNLVHAYRDLGHLIADLDPLGSSPRQHPLLRLEEFGIREADLRVDETSPSSLDRTGSSGRLPTIGRRPPAGSTSCE